MNDVSKLENEITQNFKVRTSEIETRSHESQQSAN